MDSLGRPAAKLSCLSVDLVTGPPGPRDNRRTPCVKKIAKGETEGVGSIRKELEVKIKRVSFIRILRIEIYFLKQNEM